ncbi:peptidylprolyl isomerase [Primorskyibacter aestuariivivens]|uniref:peptidylprolyl isomerase n=1 Tax=Primorskyibacter aestuariivivens TaxID=1888912 RepID=UPI002300DE83|nr:peptidylprolyl isomerase [Primorskyibacter aestuariivivens]MDA7429954.1 peptidylprolyl isomerase [Primorskyibacter aestuariivivens]
MLKSLKTTAIAAALALAANAATAQEPTADTVVATVNGTEITLGHMIMIRAGLPEQYKQLPDDVLWDGILDQLVQQTLLVQAGPEDISKRVAIALENEQRSLQAAEYMQGIMEEALTEAAVAEEYATAYADGDRGVEFNASHILVGTEAEAAELAERARGGEDFAELAKAHSTGPSGPNGGELGWFGEGMMVPEFETAVKAMGVGDVSDPVQTQFGWHVIKLNDTRVAEAPKLEEVRAELEDAVRTKAVDTTLDALKAEADIATEPKSDFDPSILQNLDLLGE